MMAGGQLQEQYNHVQEEDANCVSRYQRGPNQQRTNYQGGQDHNQWRPLQQWNDQKYNQEWSANKQGNRRAGSSPAYNTSRAPIYQQGDQSPPYHYHEWNDQQYDQGWSANKQGNRRAGSSQAYNTSRDPTYQQGDQSPPYHYQEWNDQQYDQGWSANNQGNRGAGSSQAYNASRAPIYQADQSPPYHYQEWNDQQYDQGWSANNQGNRGAGSSQAYNASRAPIYQQGNQSPPYHYQEWNDQQYYQGWSANNQGNRRAGSSQEYNASRAPTYHQGNQSLPYHSQGWNNQQLDVVASASFSAAAEQKHAELDNFLEDPPISTNCLHAFLNFDGASKGNPGLAGAGAVLRAADGSVVFRLREGLGIATNNVAEYRGLILGLEYALEKGFKHIQVQGDSNLVCLQVHNTEADDQANLAVYLRNGETQVECDVE